MNLAVGKQDSADLRQYLNEFCFGVLMRLLSFAMLALTASSIACAAQQTFNNETVTKMHTAGLNDDAIIATINSQPSSFSTTATDLIALKSAGVSDAVIAAMIFKNTAPVPAAATTPSQGGPSANDAGSPIAVVSVPTASAPIPRVFLTSQSHGTNRNAARDQSMEMSKDFERDCPGVKISLNQSAADYTVSLNHIEVGLFVRDNQFQIADRTGDLIATTKEGGSIAGGIKKACQTILANWSSRSR